MKTSNKFAALAIAFSAVVFSPAYAISDADLSAAVTSKIQANPTTATSNITVSANKGVVILSGNVLTEGEASSAIEAANATTGVKDVDTDKLMIKNSPHPYKDTYITAKVKGAFYREKLFGDTPVDATIHVETKNSVVYLTGTAQSQALVDTAISLAKSINAVQGVKSTVVISR